MAKVTKEEIAEWKKKHGDVFHISVEGKEGYFKKPDRKVLGLASAYAQKSPLKFGETIITNCWLGGDEELISNDDYFLSVNSVVDQLVEVKEVEVKKL